MPPCDGGRAWAPATEESPRRPTAGGTAATPLLHLPPPPPPYPQHEQRVCEDEQPKPWVWGSTNAFAVAAMRRGRARVCVCVARACARTRVCRREGWSASAGTCTKARRRRRLSVPRLARLASPSWRIAGAHGLACLSAWMSGFGSQGGCRELMCPFPSTLALLCMSQSRRRGGAYSSQDGIPLPDPACLLLFKYNIHTHREDHTALRTLLEVHNTRRHDRHGRGFGRPC